MITQHNQTWRAVLLHDLASVAYLNRLFRAGWYMMHIGADGMEYLAFQVPVEPPRHTTVKNFPYEFIMPSPKTLTVLVLHTSKDRNRQKAVLIEPEPDGSYRVNLVAPDGWRNVIWGLELDSGERFAILERAQFKA